MKVRILYRPDTEHEHVVREFTNNLRMQTGRSVELISLDSVEGAELAKLYDIVRYPAYIATADDGHLLKSWQGNTPLINEVSFYALGDGV